MNYRKIILTALLLVVMLAPRLPDLKTFGALDEPAWLTRGGNFYYALGQREFGNTVYEYHPAVTTMWFVTAAFITYFPEYRGLGQGYFDVDKEKFDTFMIEHGKSLLELLYFSRLFQSAAITVLAVIIFYFLSLLIGEEKAFLVTMLTASAPFFLGHSLLLNHEAFLAFCVLTSIFGMMAYLEYGHKLPYLLISAAAASLAQLTKSSAIAMMPVIAFMLATSVFQHRQERGFGRVLLDHLKVFVVWFAALIIVYVILWPGMWVAPGKMLYEVYGNAFSYAFQGARLQVTQELQPSQFSLDTAWPVITGFVSDLWWRGTFVVWVGVLLAVAAFFLHGGEAPSSGLKRLIFYLLLNAVLFILMFSVAQGRNSPHYIMTSHTSLDAVAGLGWGVWLGWFSTKWKRMSKPGVQIGLAMSLVALHLWGALSFYPYYYTFFNPLMAKFTDRTAAYGYGEGLEAAAAHLASKPDAETLTAYVYHGRGPFSFFFPGRTLTINPLFVEEPGMVPMVERLVQSDYLVFYEDFGTRSEYTARFVAALEGVQPERVISVQGLESILIYRVADFPPEFYEKITK